MSSELQTVNSPHQLVTVYLNTTTDDEGRHIPMLIGYTHGDTLKHAISYATTTPGTVAQIADAAFAAFNGYPDSNEMADLSETWYALRNRSLSVGDVVVVNGSALGVAPTGFTPLPDFVEPRVLP